MFKKVGQIILFVLFISLMAIIQFSGIYNLPAMFRNLNLFLIVLVFILFFYDFRAAIWTALISGLWFDIFSFNFFGFYLISFFLTIVFAEWILKSLLSNRSLYSFLILMLVTIITNNLVIVIFSYFLGNSFNLSFFINNNFFQIMLEQILWGEFFALILFGLANSATRRWQPSFLEKK
jgi:rod shape-determining protein MreD